MWIARMQPVFVYLNIIRLSYYIVSIIQAQQTKEVKIKFFKHVRVVFSVDAHGRFYGRGVTVVTRPSFTYTKFSKHEEKILCTLVAQLFIAIM